MSGSAICAPRMCACITVRLAGDGAIGRVESSPLVLLLSRPAGAVADVYIVTNITGVELPALEEYTQQVGAAILHCRTCCCWQGLEQHHRSRAAQASLETPRHLSARSNSELDC
jgi:hypothetical protein